MTKYLNKNPFLQNPSSGLHHQRSRREDGASSVSSAAAAGQPSAWRTSVRSQERNVRPRWTLQVFLNVHLSLGHRAAVINWLMLHIHISLFLFFSLFLPELRLTFQDGKLHVLWPGCYQWVAACWQARRLLLLSLLLLLWLSPSLSAVLTHSLHRDTLERWDTLTSFTRQECDGFQNEHLPKY